LVEVQQDNPDEFGVELGFQDPTLFSRSILQSVEDIVTVTETTPIPGVGQTQQQTIISRNPTPGFNFNNTSSALGNNASGNTSLVGTQGISNFSLGRQNGDLGFGGFVFSAQSDAVSVLVRALAARRTVHVLSRPQIRTTHNNVASIQVGQQVPVVNGVAVTDNFVTPEIIQQNVGIILRVTPRVTPDGTISMEVYAEKSALAPGGVPVFTDVTTGNVVESVIIDTAIADTTVSVPNGQTIVIGGMITKSDETLERKVPWLGDLPLIGSAFRYDGTNTARSELLIFLTPRIIYSDADSELIKQVEAERLHFVESEAEEMHGPLYSVPPSGLDNMMMPYDDVPQGEFLPPNNEMPIPEQAFPLNDFNDSSDGAIMLPPQAATSTKRVRDKSPSVPPETSTNEGNRPTPIVKAVSQTADASEKVDFNTWQMNRALSTATVANTDDASPDHDTAAAEWVRQVLRSKQQREQQLSADKSSPEATTEPTSLKTAQTTTSNKVTQAGGQRPEFEPIRTMSATEAAIDEAAVPKQDQKSETSWMRRLLKPKKQAK